MGRQTEGVGEVDCGEENGDGRMGVELGESWVYSRYIGGLVDG